MHSATDAEKEIRRLYGLVRDGLNSWRDGGASVEEEEALEQLRDLALQLLEREQARP